MRNKIESLKSGGGDITWINIVNAQKKEIEYLRRKFKFNDFDLEDSYGRKHAQRLKFHVRNNYCFIILQFPIYNRQTKTVSTEEIDFFITKNHLITLHTNKLPPMKELFRVCQKDKFYREQSMSDSNGYLFYKIVLKHQEYCYPLLDHISLNIGQMENNIFDGKEDQMIRETLSIKRNIFNTCKILEPHRNIIQKVVKEKTNFLSVKNIEMYYKDILEHTQNIWEVLQGQKELVESLEETNITLVSSKLNRIMKTLTIFSVIVFPLTLAAAIFGMNTMASMPLINHPQGFWLIIGVMGIGTICMFFYFKYKKWL
jgi:magnesium transporter